MIEKYGIWRYKYEHRKGNHNDDDDDDDDVVVVVDVLLLGDHGEEVWTGGKKKTRSYRLQNYTEFHIHTVGRYLRYRGTLV